MWTVLARQVEEDRRRGRPPGGYPAWLHALVGPEATAYVIDPTRSGAVAEAILGLDYDGTLIRDGWSPYDSSRMPTTSNASTTCCGGPTRWRRLRPEEPSAFRVGWPSSSGLAWICATVMRRGRSAGTAWPWPAAAWRTSWPT